MHKGVFAAAHQWIVATLLPPAVQTEGVAAMLVAFGGRGGGGMVCKFIQLMLLHLQLEHLDIMQIRPFACKRHSRCRVCMLA